MVQYELTDVLGIPGRDVDQEIICTAKNEELLDLGQVPQLISEGIHQVPGPRPKPHADQGLEGQAHCFGCDFDGEALDYPPTL